MLLGGGLAPVSLAFGILRNLQNKQVSVGGGELPVGDYRHSDQRHSNCVAFVGDNEVIFITAEISWSYPLWSRTGQTLLPPSCLTCQPAKAICTWSAWCPEELASLLPIPPSPASSWPLPLAARFYLPSARCLLICIFPPAWWVLMPPISWGQRWIYLL